MDPIAADLAVVGAGPGGYAAAFYAAEKGRQVVLIEQDRRLGGICLNHGCIPSKALLHVSKLITEATTSDFRGVVFPRPRIDLEKMRRWKEGMLDTLGDGIRRIGQQRGVRVLQGRASFQDSQRLAVETPDGAQEVRCEHAMIAVGSTPALPRAFDVGSPRVMTSTEALQLPEVPKTLLVVGGGYIGMELGTVYATLGSQVVLVEALDALLMGADADLVRPVARSAERTFREVRLGTKVLALAPRDADVMVTMERAGQTLEERYEAVLVAVGRRPNCDALGLERTRVTRDAEGFITVNARQQTEDPAIYAIGDVAGAPLLAHKAAKEARIAVDALTGSPGTSEDVVIPAVVYTDPEVTWCGLTEAEATARGIDVRVARFPWAASGRAVSVDRPDGLTKLIIEPGTERILGVGIAGAGAGELIGEGVLAVEMGSTARQLADIVHPHPTLSETLMECAEVFYGHATHTVGRRRP